MTTPQKQYQNVSFAELMNYARINPHRTRTLSAPMDRMAPSAIETEDQQQKKNSLSSMGLDHYYTVSLDPTGILGVLMFLQHAHEYGWMHPNDRITAVSTLATEMQSRSDEWKNTALARKRKKIYELISQSYNQTPMKKEEDALLLYEGISALYPFHFLLVRAAVVTEDGDGNRDSDHKEKGDVFFSSEPATWKSDHTVCVADYNGHWLAQHMDASEPAAWDTWLLYMEQHGWTIHWPEIDSTKADLVEKLSVYPSWKDTDKKLLKAELGRRLGKEQTLAALRR